MSFSVRLIQPNAVQEKNGQRVCSGFFENMIEMISQKSKPDIVIWPETSLYLPYNSAFEELEKMKEAAGESILIFVLKLTLQTS